MYRDLYILPLPPPLQKSVIHDAFARPRLTACMEGRLIDLSSLFIHRAQHRRRLSVCHRPFCKCVRASTVVRLISLTEQ